MRFRALRYASFMLPFVLAGCGDAAPVYPPIVIIEVGSNVGGGSSNGATNGTGNTTSHGGSSNSTAGSSGNSNAGTGSGDPLYAHCGEFANAPPPPVKTACDLSALEDGGEIKGDITADRTLTSGHSYTLKGPVRVRPGKKLTIEPCVKIMGEDPDAILVVMSSELGDPQASCTYDKGSVTPAAQLIAVGEPMAPIIFTSSKPPGQRAPGDWGGVLLLGNAHNDLADKNTRIPIEGLEMAECHGYHTTEFDTESSGHLEYVRIEYASRQVGVGSETNGLTFGSVGSGTEVHYVMVSNSNDDCIEWFGGTVNADHLIALNCDDDMFDTDTGFSGHLQFLVGRQFPTTTETDSRGFEMSQGAGKGVFPTNASISNFTVCGVGVGAPTQSLRQGIACDAVDSTTMLNGIVTGFAAEPYFISTGNGPTITNTRIFSNNTLGDPRFLNDPTNSTEEPDRFCDCWANPMAPVAATPMSGGVPTGFEDPKATYIGAFADAAAKSNWMTGLWVDWSSK